MGQLRTQMRRIERIGFASKGTLSLSDPLNSANSLFFILDKTQQHSSGGLPNIVSRLKFRCQSPKNECSYDLVFSKERVVKLTPVFPFCMLLLLILT